MGKVWNGRIGIEKSVEDFSEAEARQIFGDKLYKSWKMHKTNIEESQKRLGNSELKVTAIDPIKKTITVGRS